MYSKRSMHILEITFHAFFEDIKKLVSNGIKHDIGSINTKAKSPSELEAAWLNARCHKSALKSWVKLTQSLAYGNDNGSDAYKLLVNTVVADKDLISYGLPNLQEHSMPPSTLAQLLLHFASTHNTS